MEYVLYEALRQSRERGVLLFAYESSLTLPFSGEEIEIKPDFTVIVGNRRYYWEHLGMLDREDYSSDWEQRHRAYEAKGLLDSLITSDDSNGIRAETVSRIIEDLVAGTPAKTPGDPFSQHHYQL